MGLFSEMMDESGYLKSEIARLKEAIEMANNRLECSLLDEGVCRHCVELAQSYLKEGLAPVSNGER